MQRQLIKQGSALQGLPILIQNLIEDSNHSFWLFQGKDDYRTQT
jgi:hypothetical protein